MTVPPRSQGIEPHSRRGPSWRTKETSPRSGLGVGGVRGEGGGGGGGGGGILCVEKGGIRESAPGVKRVAVDGGKGGGGRSYLNLCGQGRSDVFRCCRSLIFECAYRRILAKHTVKVSLRKTHRRPQRALSRPQQNLTNSEDAFARLQTSGQRPQVCLNWKLMIKQAQALCPLQLRGNWTQCLAAWATER